MGTTDSKPEPEVVGDGPLHVQGLDSTTHAAKQNLGISKENRINMDYSFRGKIQSQAKSKKRSYVKVFQRAVSGKRPDWDCDHEFRSTTKRRRWSNPSRNEKAQVSTGGFPTNEAAKSNDGTQSEVSTLSTSVPRPNLFSFLTVPTVEPPPKVIRIVHKNRSNGRSGLVCYSVPCP